MALGGDNFDFVTAHGNTEVSPRQMMYFVLEQVYAISSPKRLSALSDRLALAIRDAYRPGARSAMGACVPPGTRENWCRASRPNATFTEQWAIFRSWR